MIFLGVGLLKYAEGKKHNIGDQVPVDHVVSGIIVSAAYYANKKQLNVVHSGTSEKNPVTWETATVTIKKYWQENMSVKSISPKPTFELIDSPARLRVSKYW